MPYAVVIDSQPTEWDGRPWRDANGFGHPANAPSLYSEAELRAAGLYEILETEIPADKISVGWVLECDAVGEAVTRSHLLEDRPETPPAEPVATPPQIVACALRVPIVNDEVQQVGGAYRIAAMILLDTGTFMAVFTENLGETEPFLVPNNGVSVSIAEWGQEYAVIEVRDHAGGTLITPASFGFSLYKF